MSLRPSQFRLRTALVFFAGISFLSSLVRYLGPVLAAVVILAILVVLGLLAVWALLHVLAPRATTHITVLAAMVFVSISLLSMWLVRAREQARRCQCIQNLQESGVETLQTQEFHPNHRNGHAEFGIGRSAGY